MFQPMEARMSRKITLVDFKKKSGRIEMWSRVYVVPSVPSLFKYDFILCGIQNNKKAFEINRACKAIDRG